MNWNHKGSWQGLMAAILVAGLGWITLSRAPADVMAVRSQRPPSPQVGFAAPDFSLETLDGETITLSDLRGQAVLVNFWATWCPPCRKEMPAIQQLYEQYRGQGFTVLAVDLQESEAQVADFTAQMGLTFPILIDSGGQVFSRYGVRALPSTFFVDPDGIIQEIALGGPLAPAYLESQVVNLLAAQKPER